MKLRDYVGLFLSLGLLIGITLFAVSPVNAQETSQIRLSITPPVIDENANPGDTLTGSFKVVNGTDEVVELDTFVKNFLPSDEDGGVDITEDDTTYSLADWITVTPLNSTLPARGSQVFDYIITVPDNAEPGSHLGTILVQSQAAQIDVNGPSVSQEVGTLILVKVAGDTFQEASIVDFSTDSSFLEKGPVVFNTRLENTGNVHFKPRGQIVIKDTFGREVTTIDLSEKNVLPDSTRKIVDEWNPNGFTIGRYTADLTVIYGDGDNDQIITASTSFTIFPYKTVVPAILVAVFFITAAFKYRTRIMKAVDALRNG